jgi:hypothetical protein
LLQFRQSDYLTASIGRMHTWVGYYNTAFNKGEFLETTTDRPFIYAFDDEGGVLPMQDVGVNLTGKIPSGKLGLNYVFELGNGRDWYPLDEPAQITKTGIIARPSTEASSFAPSDLRACKWDFRSAMTTSRFPVPRWRKRS